jgi:anti-sigma factor (TIGR02949 family)
MENHNCRDLLGSLSDYVDGELEAELCAQLEQHLASCENCRIVVDSLHKTVYLYQTTAAQSGVPHGVRERLFSRLNLDEFLKK